MLIITIAIFFTMAIIVRSYKFIDNNRIDVKYSILTIDPSGKAKYVSRKMMQNIATEAIKPALIISLTSIRLLSINL